MRRRAAQVRASRCPRLAAWSCPWPHAWCCPRQPLGGICARGIRARRRALRAEGCSGAHAASTNTSSVRANAVSAPSPARTRRTCAPARLSALRGSEIRSVSEYAVPAMSRCTHVYSCANSARNSAAVIVPAPRPPTFFMSATSDLICSRYSGHIGSCQPGSPPRLAGGEHFVDHALVITQHARGRVPERDDDRARERRRIDHGLRLESRRVREHVREDQPAFGIGVDDLDRLAVARADDVARIHRGARRHVGRRAHEADDVDLQLHPRDGFHGAEDAGRAAHVELHPFHAVGGLDRNAARIEAEPLPDERHRRSRRRRRRGTRAR